MSRVYLVAVAALLLACGSDSPTEVTATSTVPLHTRWGSIALDPGIAPDAALAEVERAAERIAAQGHTLTLPGTWIELGGTYGGSRGTYWDASHISVDDSRAQALDHELFHLTADLLGRPDWCVRCVDHGYDLTCWDGGYDLDCRPL